MSELGSQAFNQSEDLPTLHLVKSEIIDWRNIERQTITKVLAKDLDKIKMLVRDTIDGMSLLDFRKTAAFHDKNLAPLVESWATYQVKSLHRKLEITQHSSHEIQKTTSGSYQWSGSDLKDTAKAASIALTPIAAIAPFATSLATITTSSFLIFTTSVISIPILVSIIGLASLGGLGLTKFKANSMLEKTKTRYFNQIANEIDIRVLGNPKSGNHQSLLDYLLALIDQKAIDKIRQLS